MQSQLLTLAEVLKITSVSRSTIYRLMALGTFPAPLNISTQRVGWDKAEVEQWMRDRACMRGL